MKKRKIVVVSAPGKRTSDDEKVTDLLIQLATSHIEGNYDEEVLKKILVRYKEICDELELKPEVFELVRIHFKNLKERNDLAPDYLMDAYKASGEDLNARLIASYFNQEGLAAKYVGPREAKLWVSDTPGEARVLEESYHELEYLQLTNEVIVFPGFYGGDKRRECRDILTWRIGYYRFDFSQCRERRRVRELYRRRCHLCSES